MSRVEVLVEIERVEKEPFRAFEAFASSEREAVSFGEQLLEKLTGFGLEVQADPPVPMLRGAGADESGHRSLEDLGLAGFASSSGEIESETFIIAASVPVGQLSKIEAEANVWPNSELSLLHEPALETTDSTDDDSNHPFDLARSSSGVDCRPFRPAVSLSLVRRMLGVERVWQDGFRGQNIIVGIIDEGINGSVYPVVGGFTRDNSAPPGSASISSHGSMCAADVLVAAPSARLYDYPFLGRPRSGGALAMFQAILDQRRIDGTPHVTSNSYGFYGRPPREQAPRHEVWDPNHPLHRKVREVVASGAPTFFAAGNCGEPCPSGRCHPSGIGPGSSIHASSSLKEVITVAAVNARHERIGYSSQGPGGFDAEKPDVAAYSHFYGNFGPGRPAGGGRDSFDSGTSAACPVAAGVGALLLSAFFGKVGARLLREALVQTAINLGTWGWDPDTGHGVINAAAAYAWLREQKLD